MNTFREWLTEMASVLPQNAEDNKHPDRVRTTHMRIPVWAPTILHLILHRDQEKYPLGMTASEVSEELVNQSEGRIKPEDLLPGERPAPEDWKTLIKGNWAAFVRGNTSQMNKAASVAHSPVLTIVGHRDKGKGKSPAIYAPPLNVTDQSGAKFLKKSERGAPRWIKPSGEGTPIEKPPVTSEPPAVVQPPVDIPSDIEDKDIGDVLKNMFQ